MTKQIKIASIEAGSHHRPIDSKRLKQIMDSMEKLGLRYPVSLRRDGKQLILVAGAHRLEAAKRLGWQEISAEVIAFEGADAELWQIDENLCRADLTSPQRAQHTRWRKEVWKKQGEVGGKSLPTHLDSQGRRKSPQQGKGFASETAEATGRSKRSVNQDIARAKKIKPKVLEMVDGTPLGKGTELDRLAKIPKDEQEATVKEALGRTQGTATKPTLRTDHYKKLEGFWDSAPEEVKWRFAVEVVQAWLKQRDMGKAQQC